MNKTALYGLILGVFIPVTAYFIMRFIPPANVMPYRLFYDDVRKTVKNGKETDDTVWSRVPDLNLTNQQGEKVSWKNLEGKVIVANFFFTRCPQICPRLMENMKRLQEAVKNNNKAGTNEANFVQFLSITVDPLHDSVTELKKYANRFQINPQNWWLLTGDKKQIYNLALNGMKLGISETDVDTAFIHSQSLVLIDRDRVIRARHDSLGNIKLYNGLDSNDVKNIAEDIILLRLEKEKKGKFFLADELPLIGVVMVVAILGVIVLMFVLKMNKSI